MRNIYPAVLLVIFGFAIYLNILNSPFHMDDYGQIEINPDIKNLSNIPAFYFKSSPHIGGGQIPDFYRPIFLTAYTLLFILGNGLPFSFHLFQVSVFSINAVLVFLFFTKFFKRRLAFLLALLFLVHPANEEAAQYIAALSEPLFFNFGMIALLLVSSKKIKSVSTVYLYSFMILLSLLSKETGVLFFIITLIYILFFQSYYFKNYLLASGFAGLAYFVLRFTASRNPVSILTESQYVLSIGERAILVPKVIYSYIELVTATTISLPNAAYLQRSDIKSAIFPFLADFFILASLLAVGVWIKRYFKSSFKIYAFFFIWTMLGLGIHSQIIPLEVFIASRWMYFSVAGALGMLGIITILLKPYLSKHRVLFLVLFFLYLSVCITMTLILNIHRAGFSGYIDKTEGIVKLF